MAPTDVRNAFHQMRIPAWLFSFFGLPFLCVSEIIVASQTIEEKRSVPTTHPMGFCWAMFPCQDVTDECTASGVADEPSRLASFS